MDHAIKKQGTLNAGKVVGNGITTTARKFLLNSTNVAQPFVQQTNIYNKHIYAQYTRTVHTHTHAHKRALGMYYYYCIQVAGGVVNG